MLHTDNLASTKVSLDFPALYH